MKKPRIKLRELDLAFRKDQFPIEAKAPDEWRQFMDLLSTFDTETPWLGYEVSSSASLPITHAVIFMGRNEGDTRCGVFHTIELASPKGKAKITLWKIDTGRSTSKLKDGDGDMDVRGTSQEFLDLLFIVLKSSI